MSYRVGEKIVCSNEMIASIIVYRSYQDIDVQFDDGLVVEHISYARFFQAGVPHTVGGPIDEILKDADVLHHTLADPTKEVKEHEKARYEKLRVELGYAEGNE